MKKIIITLAVLFGPLLGTSSFAMELPVPKFTAGISGHAGILSATGKEFLRNGEGTLSAQGVKSKSRDMFIGYGTIFGEVYIDERFRIGYDYAPNDLVGDTVTGVHASKNAAQGGTGEADRTQKVQVTLTDLNTAYLAFHSPIGVFVKAGIIQAHLITNETLDSGSQYPNADLNGYTIGAGYERPISLGDAEGIFIRGEINQTVFEKIALNATGSENTNHINIDDISGTNAVISIGKNF